MLAVFTDGTKTVEELLEPYDASVEVPTYVRETKVQIIKRLRKEMEDYKTKGQYAKWLSNKDEYEKNINNASHLEYLRSGFLKKYNSTDEELYKEELKNYEEHEIDENGGVTSTYNPISKWDWFRIGGRWRGMINATKGERGEYYHFEAERYEYKENEYDVAKVIDITFDDEFLTYAVLLPSGEWFEQEDGGINQHCKEVDRNWRENYKKNFIETANKDWTLTMVDCHI